MLENLLKSSGLDRLDAELLLVHILKKDRLVGRSLGEGRSWILAHGDEEISDVQNSEFGALVTRRKKHEPIAYIIGKKEFYGRKFKVDKRVLIPRPATETLIDEVKYLFENNFDIETPRITQADSEIVIASYIKDYSLSTTHYPLIVDIGTGSGCIAITLALEIPEVKIIATDISSDVLEVAEENVELHEVTDRVTFIKCDLIPDINSPFLIVSNPPYIPNGEKMMEDVIEFEPREALFGGDDGKDVIKAIVQEAKNNSQCLGYCLEMRKSQVAVT